MEIDAKYDRGVIYSTMKQNEKFCTERLVDWVY